MNENYLYFGIAVLFVILIGILFSRNFIANFTEKGLEVSKKEGKDNVKVSKVRNKSKLDLNTKPGQDVEVKDISDSEVKLNKDSENS